MREQRPLEYRGGDSIVHRAGPVTKLVAATLCAATAVLLDSHLLLAALIAAVAAGYAVAGMGPRELWRDLRWLVVQGAIIALLTVLVRGTGAVGDGCRTAFQLVAIFLPFALVIRTTAVLEVMRGWLPEHLGFAVGATLRFAPMFARELAELVEMQRLRGARLSLRQLAHPLAWRDWLACVALPMGVRAIEVAEEAADAALIRGISAGAQHTSKERT